MIRSPLKFITIGVVLLFFGQLPCAMADEMSGRFSIDNYYSRDTAASHDFNITTFRLKLDITKLRNSKSGFHFKGAERIKSSTSDVSNKINSHRIYALNIDYVSPSDTVHIITGRQTVEESVGSSVDGMHAKFEVTGKSSFGVFGGLKADPYKESFHSDYTTLGSYYSYKEKKFDSNLGFVHDGYKGGSDRDYAFLQLYYLPIKIINFHQSLILDIGQESAAVELTQFNLGSNITPTRKSRISLSYSQFKTIKLKKSMEYTMDRNIQRTLNLRVQYRIYKSIKIYTRYNLRNRDRDNKSAQKIQLGANGPLPYLNEIFFHMRYSQDYYFTADNNALFFEINRQFFDLFDTTVSVEYQQNKPEREEITQEVLIYNIAFDYNISRTLYLTLTYEYLSEQDFNTSSIFSKIGFRF